MRETLVSRMQASLEPVEAVVTTPRGDSPSRQPRPFLVLGIGNILLRDEGMGVRVVEAMQRQESPADVEIFDGATLGLDLLEVVADRRLVVVIDVVDVDAIDGRYPPGTVMRLDSDDLQAWRGPGISLHGVGLADTLAVAGVLGCAPEEVVLLGVVPKIVEEGLELSEELAAIVSEMVRLVRTELGRRVSSKASCVCSEQDTPEDVDSR